MSVMLCTGATLVAGIVSFVTAGLHLLTLCILEPLRSKDIGLDLSHVISH